MLDFIKRQHSYYMPCYFDGKTQNKSYIALARDYLSCLKTHFNFCRWWALHNACLVRLLVVLAQNTGIIG
jgi:hypothetical protein